jgi:hypothetical protein
MLTREQNDLLCRVEGDAPMGALARPASADVRFTPNICRADRMPPTVEMGRQ